MFSFTENTLFFFQRGINVSTTDTTLHKTPLTEAIATHVLYTKTVEPLGQDTEEENPVVTGTENRFLPLYKVKLLR